MNFEMQKANMLADNIIALLKFVQKNYEVKNSFYSNPDKWYQIKLLMEEYKFKILAEELKRINRFIWDEKYTHYLVKQFRKGKSVIDEYVKNNYDDLFILTAKLYTLEKLCQSFYKEQVG
ncbi:hypothetical protein F7731_12575 [Cytobacillus depressus]|uniref:Uncharacterized protein n=1 Tax=Cytobacillus depressus TaxID=1602942 RepID=A0A6L3V7L3_9BACI|nr:hypothetical protein [Cytobacillus depressus]KAB2336316.1 hypothetical protein F7731_12575 [Cytobacillus depressus]